jgi:tetratricopeptide (TPR) repeat protein
MIKGASIPRHPGFAVVILAGVICLIASAARAAGLLDSVELLGYDLLVSALPSRLHWFETEVLSRAENLAGLRRVRILVWAVLLCAVVQQPCAAQFPECAKGHVPCGIALQNMGDVDGTIAEFRTAICVNPNDAVAHYNLGEALRLKGDLDGAIAEYREAIRLKPDYAEAHDLCIPKTPSSGFPSMSHCYFPVAFLTQSPFPFLHVADFKDVHRGWDLRDTQVLL